MTTLLKLACTIEFAVAKSKDQDVEDQRWVYQVNGRMVVGSSWGRGWENKERMTS